MTSPSNTAFTDEPDGVPIVSPGLSSNIFVKPGTSYRPKWNQHYFLINRPGQFTTIGCKFRAQFYIACIYLKITYGLFFSHLGNNG